MEAGGMSWLEVIGLVATVICAVEGIVRLVRKDRRWGVVLFRISNGVWSPHRCSWDGMTAKEMPVHSVTIKDGEYFTRTRKRIREDLRRAGIFSVIEDLVGQLLD